MDCPFTTCFFDMEYKKTSQQKEVEEVKIDRFFITQKYKLLKTLEPSYNRLVLFDGLKFIHGMDVTNDRYFGNESRNNQVFFFDSVDEQIEYFCV